jgi:hypothetical protein
MATTEMWTYRGDVRSDADLDGYEVEARDGSIGTVDEATNEVDRSYLIIDTGPWIFGRRALLPAGVIERIDHNNRRVYVNRTRDEVRRAPEYDPAAGFSNAYRQRIGTHYGTGATTGVTLESETPRRTPAQSRQSRASSRSRSSSSRTRSSSSRSRSSSSRTRSQAKSSTSRGRSTRRQSDGPTKEELYEQAKRLNIEGRSKMNKTQLARAVGRKRGGSTTQARTTRGRQTQSRSRQTQSRSRRTRSGRSRSKATPVEVQAFLDGVSYPTRKGDLVREAERSGARREVRTTLERLPEQRFGDPTEVSEAIGKLR